VLLDLEYFENGEEFFVMDVVVKLSKVEDIEMKSY